MRHVRNRFVSRDYSKLSGKFISQYRNFHRNMNTFNTKQLETKPNQLLHQRSPTLPCQQKRIPTVTNIETDNNNKKHKPTTERRNNWICREQRVQSFEKRRIIGLFVGEERCHPPWPGSIKTITTQSGGSNPI